MVLNAVVGVACSIGGYTSGLNTGLFSAGEGRR